MLAAMREECTLVDMTVALLCCLAAAQYLAKHKSFDGTVYFVFQPGEEKGDGERVMVDGGLFEKSLRTLYLACATGLIYL